MVEICKWPLGDGRRGPLSVWFGDGTGALGVRKGFME